VENVANQAPAATGEQVVARYFYGKETFHSQAEREVASLLTALAHNYQHVKNEAKLKSVSSLLRHYDAYLDEQGRAFAALAKDGACDAVPGST
jgi:hypothetical protein